MSEVRGDFNIMKAELNLKLSIVRQEFVKMRDEHRSLAIEEAEKLQEIWQSKPMSYKISISRKDYLEELNNHLSESSVYFKEMMIKRKKYFDNRKRKIGSEQRTAKSTTTRKTESVIKAKSAKCDERIAESTDNVSEVKPKNWKRHQSLVDPTNSIQPAWKSVYISLMLSVSESMPYIAALLQPYFLLVANDITFAIRITAYISATGNLKFGSLTAVLSNQRDQEEASSLYH